MFAVIETGGKQYIVRAGQRVRVEKLPSSDKEVIFDAVLMVGDENEIKLGAPTLKDVVVQGEIVQSGRAKKLIAYKYRRRKRTRVKKGHRQSYVEVQITHIGPYKKEIKTAKEAPKSEPKTAKTPALKRKTSQKAETPKKKTAKK